ncbi:16288_t:CDS:1, partial [Acaulospora colombiana]
VAVDCVGFLAAVMMDFFAYGWVLARPSSLPALLSYLKVHSVIVGRLLEALVLLL